MMLLWLLLEKKLVYYTLFACLYPFLAIFLSEPKCNYRMAVIFATFWIKIEDFQAGFPLN